jgi:predicted ABC-type ATPase
LYFICTSSAELNVARVLARVSTGGHAVPEEKIRERYLRSLQLAREAISCAYRAYFFDNSGISPIWLAEFDGQGRCNLKVAQSDLPQWFRDWVWDQA